MFVRKKRISGREYYYLVKSVREGATVRQKFVEYLGSEMPAKNEIERVKAKFRGDEKAGED